MVFGVGLFLLLNNRVYFQYVYYEMVNVINVTNGLNSPKEDLLEKHD